MKKILLTLFCLLSLTLTINAESYTHTFNSGELKIAGGTVILSDIEWNTTSATYIGWDKNGKGVQIGSKNSPNTTTYTLSTSAFAGCTIKSVTVKSAIAASGDARMTISVAGQTSEEYTLTTTATEYTFDCTDAAGDIAINWNATQRAYYVASVTVEYTPDASSVTVPMPEFKTPVGIYADELTVTAETTDQNAVLYYTLDGTDPSYEDFVNETGTTLCSKYYVMYPKITEKTTIKAMAVIVDGETAFKSNIAEATYIVSRTMPYVNTEEIIDGKEYAMVAADSAACYNFDEGSYGYLPTKTATKANENYIETVECAGFTFTGAAGGYYIQDELGRYIYHKGTYTSFNYAYEKPAEGAVWSVTTDSDGNAVISCDGYTIHYSTEYMTFGCYPADKVTEEHILPKLYRQREYPTFTITPEANSSIDKLETITIHCEEGIATAGFSAIASGYECETEMICRQTDKNTIVLTAATPITTLNNISVQINISGDIMLNPADMNMPLPVKSKYGVRTLVSYNLTGNAPAATITEVSPANNATVEELSHFIFTFSYYASHTDDTTIQPKLYVEGSNETIALERTTDNGNGGMIEMEQAALKTAEPLIGNGTYILEIPDGYFTDGNGKNIAGIVLRYVVKNDSGIIAGIADTMADNTDGWRVFNVAGVKLFETTDINRIKALPSGIYIINGEKVYLK